MKIDLKFSLKSILPFILKRFSVVLWVFLGIIILAEAFTIKSSVDMITQANSEPLLNTAQLLRVNFESYEKIDKRLSHNLSFTPSEPKAGDPFGLPAKK